MSIVEITHIYGDEEFNDRHVKAIDIYKSMRQDTIKSIFIDDYHSPLNFSIDYVIDFFEENGIQLDMIAFESGFEPVVETMISELPIAMRKFDDRIVHMYSDIGLLNDGKPTCVALSAAWSLCRAGYYSFPEKAIINLTNTRIDSNSAFTILDRKYNEVENKVKTMLEYFNIKSEYVIY